MSVKHTRTGESMPRACVEPDAQFCRAPVGLAPEEKPLDSRSGSAMMGPAGMEPAADAREVGSFHFSQEDIS